MTTSTQTKATVTPTPLPKGTVKIVTKKAKAKGKTTTGKRRGRPPGSKNVMKGKRGPGRPRLSGSTRGTSSGLLMTILRQNGFSDDARLVITEARRPTVTLPVGLFTSK